MSDKPDLITRLRYKTCSQEGCNECSLRREAALELASLKNQILTGVEERETLGRSWSPISTAPKDRTPVLILTSYEKMATAYWSDDTWIDWMRPQHSYGSVTHWMPLPPIDRKIEPATPPCAHRYREGSTVCEICGA